jgi:hypothetical protein
MLKRNGAREGCMYVAIYIALFVQLHDGEIRRKKEIQQTSTACDIRALLWRQRQDDNIKKHFCNTTIFRRVSERQHKVPSSWSVTLCVSPLWLSMIAMKIKGKPLLLIV